MRSCRWLVGRTGAILLACWLCHSSAAAQALTGRITGTVRDAGGGAVGDVELQALETESGRSWVTSSDAEGVYSFPALPPGIYRVVARRAGFRMPAADSVDLSIKQAARLDI